MNKLILLFLLCIAGLRPLLSQEVNPLISECMSSSQTQVVVNDNLQINDPIYSGVESEYNRFKTLPESLIGATYLMFAHQDSADTSANYLQFVAEDNICITWYVSSGATVKDTKWENVAKAIDVSSYIPIMCFNEGVTKYRQYLRKGDSLSIGGNRIYTDKNEMYLLFIQKDTHFQPFEILFGQTPVETADNMYYDNGDVYSTKENKTFGWAEQALSSIKGSYTSVLCESDNKWRLDLESGFYRVQIVYYNEAASLSINGQTYENSIDGSSNSTDDSIVTLNTIVTIGDKNNNCITLQNPENIQTTHIYEVHISPIGYTIPTMYKASSLNSISNDGEEIVTSQTSVKYSSTDEQVLSITFSGIDSLTNIEKAQFELYPRDITTNDSITLEVYAVNRDFSSSSCSLENADLLIDGVVCDSLTHISDIVCYPAQKDGLIVDFTTFAKESYSNTISFIIRAQETEIENEIVFVTDTSTVDQPQITLFTTKKEVVTAGRYSVEDEGTYFLVSDILGKLPLISSFISLQYVTGERVGVKGFYVPLDSNTINVVSDTILPPRVELLPKSSQWNRDGLPKWEWKSEDSVSSYRFKFDDKITTTNETVFLPSSPIEDGEYTFYLQAKSENSEWSEVISSQVIVDKTAPEITITVDYKDGSESAVASVSIADKSDNVKSEYCVTHQLEDTSSKIFTPLVYNQIQLESLKPGLYTLVVNATDEAGNSSSKSTSFQVKGGYPILSIDEVGKFTSNSKPQFSWTILSGTSIDSDVKACYTLDGNPLLDVNGTSFTPIAELSEGEHSFTISATNGDNKTTTESIAFVVDTKSPEISNVVYNATAFTYTWRGQDQSYNGNLIRYYYKVGSDSTWTETSDTVSSTVAMGDAFFLYAVDKAGNKSEIVKKGEGKGVELEFANGVKISIPDSALSNKEQLTAVNVGGIQSYAGSRGESNTDALVIGDGICKPDPDNTYEVFPPQEFSKPVLLTLPFKNNNTDLLYFNEEKRLWEKVKVVKVDEENGFITGEVHHFSIYATGVQTLATEPPQAQGINTKNANTQPVDPMAGIKDISAPSPNNMGTANLSYPIEVPAGINGVTPKLALTYTNSVQRGNTGAVGWNLNATSVIEIDVSEKIAEYGEKSNNLDGEGKDDYFNNTFLLDGQELVAINKEQRPGEYYLKVQGESQSPRVQFDLENGEVVVHNLDGSKSFYGGTVEGVMVGSVNGIDNEVTISDNVTSTIASGTEVALHVLNLDMPTEANSNIVAKAGYQINLLPGFVTGENATFVTSFDKITVNDVNNGITTENNLIEYYNGGFLNGSRHYKNCLVNYNGKINTVEERCRQTYRWYLTRVEDKFGNKITYEYKKCTNGDGNIVNLVPETIKYGYTDEHSHMYSIKIGWNDVGTFRESYRCKFQNQDNQQLRDIAVTSHINGQNKEINKFNIGYEVGAFGRQILVSLSDNKSSNEHSFEYDTDVSEPFGELMAWGELDEYMLNETEMSTSSSSQNLKFPHSGHYGEVVTWSDIVYHEKAPIPCPYRSSDNHNVDCWACNRTDFLVNEDGNTILGCGKNHNAKSFLKVTTNQYLDEDNSGATIYRFVSDLIDINGDGKVDRFSNGTITWGTKRYGRKESMGFFADVTACKSELVEKIFLETSGGCDGKSCNVLKCDALNCKYCFNPRNPLERSSFSLCGSPDTFNITDVYHREENTYYTYTSSYFGDVNNDGILDFIRPSIIWDTENKLNCKVSFLKNGNLSNLGSSNFLGCGSLKHLSRLHERSDNDYSTKGGCTTKYKTDPVLTYSGYQKSICFDINGDFIPDQLVGSRSNGESGVYWKRILNDFDIDPEKKEIDEPRDTKLYSIKLRNINSSGAFEESQEIIRSFPIVLTDYNTIDLNNDGLNDLINDERVFINKGQYFKRFENYEYKAPSLSKIHEGGFCPNENPRCSFSGCQGHFSGYNYIDYMKYTRGGHVKYVPKNEVDYNKLLNIKLNNIINESMIEYFNGKDKRKQDTYTALGDFDGDGNVDLFYRDTISGHWAMSITNGSLKVKSLKPLLTDDEVTKDNYTFTAKDNLVGVKWFHNGQILRIQHNSDKPIKPELSGKNIIACFKDMNGDGAVDYVVKRKGEPMMVRLNQMAHKNILTSVTNTYTGNKVDLEYGMTFCDPNRETTNNYREKFVLKSFTATAKTELNTISQKTSIEYENGIYDRIEKEFRGFETLTVKSIDRRGNGDEIENVSETVFNVTDNFGQNYCGNYIYNTYLKGTMKSQTTKFRKKTSSGDFPDKYDTLSNSEYSYKIVSPFGKTVGTKDIQLSETDIKTINVYSGIQHVFADAVWTTYYKEDGTKLIREKSMSSDIPVFDPNSGLIISKSSTSYGDPYKVGEDDITTTITFSNNSSEWVSLPTTVVSTYIGGTLSEQNNTYYPNGSLASESNWMNDNGEGKSFHLTTFYEYDTFGNVCKLTTPDKLTVRSTIDYNQDGYSAIIKTMDPSGMIEISKLNEYGLETEHIDKFGDKMTMEYSDIFNRLISVIETIDNSDVETKSFEYKMIPLESKGAKLFSVSCSYKQSENSSIENKRIRYTKNSLGQNVQTVEANEVDGETKAIVSRAIWRDPMGRATAVGEPTVHTWGQDYYDNLSTSISTESAVTKYSYDSRGRVSKVENPNGTSVKLSYGIDTDRGFNLSAEESGLYTEVVTTLLSGTTTLQKTKEYNDINGEVGYSKALKDDGNYSTSMYRRNLKWETQVIELVPSKDLNSDGEAIVGYNWGNSLGSAIKIQSPDAGTSVYVYNQFGQLKKKIEKGRNSDEPTVGDNSNLEREINYSYDVLGRLIAIDYGIQSENIYFTYYPNSGVDKYCAGEINTIYRGNYSITYLYDQLSITEIKRFVGTSDTKEFSTTYTYDLQGKTTKVAYPDGSDVSYGYSDGGELSSITGNKDGVLTDYISSIVYDKYGQRTKVVYGNGQETNYTYDANTRLLDKMKVTHGTDELLTFNYTFDKTGNLSVLNSSMGSNSYEQNYSYDKLGRISVGRGSENSTPKYNENYIFDNANRMESWKKGGLEYHNVYAPGSHKLEKSTFSKEIVTGRNSWTGELKTTKFNITTFFGYDDYGNLVNQSYEKRSTYPSVSAYPSAMKNTYSYNAANQLVKFQGPGNSAEYQYDNAGRRISKKVFDSDNSIEKTDLYVNGFYSVKYFEKDCFVDGFDGGVVTRHISDGQNIIASVLQNNADNTVYYTQNNIGSTSMLTDNNGEIKERYLFKPFGETWVQSNSSFTNVDRLFTGQMMDTESGLYYMNARYYNPLTGVFLTPDPAMDGLNHYGYVSGNPISYTDPTGMYRYYSHTPKEKAQSPFGLFFSFVKNLATWSLETQKSQFREALKYSSSDEIGNIRTSKENSIEDMIDFMLTDLVDDNMTFKTFTLEGGINKVSGLFKSSNESDGIYMGGLFRNNSGAITIFEFGHNHVNGVGFSPLFDWSLDLSLNWSEAPPSQYLDGISREISLGGSPGILSNVLGVVRGVHDDGNLSFYGFESALTLGISPLWFSETTRPLSNFALSWDIEQGYYSPISNITYDPQSSSFNFNWFGM